MRPLFLFVLPVLATTMAACALADDFPKPYDSQKTETGPTSAADAVKKLRLPRGFRATLFAAEPDVQQPIAITTDERGRLWVAENYTYSEAGLNYDTSLRDRIVILEDVDNDGTFDKRTVFWDDAMKLTSVEVGFGGVWALCAPNLLFIPDRDRDDVPDGPPEVLLDGWDDFAIRHNIVNGLKWGPDGWLYGRHGITTSSLVGKPGEPESRRTPVTCGIWRYHPTRKEFEVVAAGGTNPWGFDFDDHGEMFMINTVIGHLWHVVPGAYYRRMFGAHFNPYVYEVIEQTADHFHWDVDGEAWHELKKTGMTDATDRAGGGHAHCGLMIYLGDNWPDKYRNGVFTLNLHGRRINHDRLEREGNGYVGKHEHDFMLTDDEWFRGIELVYGPDGGVYVLDWSDIGECHENDGVHRSSGRIYKIVYGELNEPPGRDLSRLNNVELVNLQGHGNDWYVRTARRLLQERAIAGQNLDDATAGLKKTFKGHPDARCRLRAMWALYSIGAIGKSRLLAASHDRDEHIRVWAVRLLIDREGDPPPDTVVRLMNMARSDESPLVRLYLASALRALSDDDRLKLGTLLAQHASDNDDRMQPRMIWYGIQPAVMSNGSAALSLAMSSRMPLVRRFIARRFAAGIDEAPRSLDLMISRLAEPADPRIRLDILSGLAEGLTGRRKAPKPQAWDAVSERLASTGNENIRRLVRELGVVFGDGRALDDVRKIATDNSQPHDARRNAVDVLVRSRPDDLFATLKPLINDRVMIEDAIAGLAVCNDESIPRLVLSKYDRLSPAGKGIAIDTLVARPASAQALLKAVDDGDVPRSAVSAFHARQMRSYDDSSLNNLLIRVWGDVRESSAERRQQMAALKLKFGSEDSDSADRASGRLTFKKNCASCHTLFGTGGNIGPDLTGSNRKNIDYLLENIVDPSASVAAAWRMSVLALEDGRVLNGVIVNETPQTVEVQTQKEKLTIAKSEIDERRETKQSLMPEGILKTLTDDQIRGLLAYLRSPSQVPLPQQSD